LYTSKFNVSHARSLQISSLREVAVLEIGQLTTPQVSRRNLIQGLTTGETVSRGLSAEDETRKLPKIREIVNLAAIL